MLLSSGQLRSDGSGAAGRRVQGARASRGPPTASSVESRTPGRVSWNPTPQDYAGDPPERRTPAATRISAGNQDDSVSPWPATPMPPESATSTAVRTAASRAKAAVNFSPPEPDRKSVV